jgi:hypothetical protein
MLWVPYFWDLRRSDPFYRHAQSVAEGQREEIDYTIASSCLSE